MKLKTQIELDDTLKYLIKESLDSLEQIKEDPANVLWESGLKLPDDEYDEALEYVTNWHR